MKAHECEEIIEGQSRVELFEFGVVETIEKMFGHGLFPDWRCCRRIGFSTSPARLPCASLLQYQRTAIPHLPQILH